MTCRDDKVTHLKTFKLSECKDVKTKPHTVFVEKQANIMADDMRDRASPAHSANEGCSAFETAEAVPRSPAVPEFAALSRQCLLLQVGSSFPTHCRDFMP